MSEIVVGARVRALTEIPSGYGAGRRVVEPGQEGTVLSFSRTKNYPQVEWDAGWTSLCRPDDVEPIEDARRFGAGEVADRLRGVVPAALSAAGMAVERVNGTGEDLNLVLRNGQRFTVTIRERDGAAPDGKGEGGIISRIGSVIRGRGEA
ncbi:MAG TPA: hypothetical protein VFQ39_13210 [Longimicrobium sp.]|nr:hypothetical protein [Longimicrobium sp.]